MSIDWTKYESNKYFSCKNFGGPADFTITGVIEEPVGQAKDVRVVVYVREDPKGVILNVGRAKALRKAFGNHEARWTGKRFRLLKVPGTFAGELCEMLVIQAPVPALPVQPPSPEEEVPLPDDSDNTAEIPF